MGKGALNKHGKSVKHSFAIQERRNFAKDFFPPTDVKTSTSKNNTPSTSSSSADNVTPNEIETKPGVQRAENASSMNQYVTREEVLAAEVTYALKNVKDTASFSSADGTGDIFGQMFPDSEIAEKFNMQALHLGCTIKGEKKMTSELSP